MLSFIFDHESEWQQDTLKLNKTVNKYMLCIDVISDGQKTQALCKGSFSSEGLAS